MFRARGCTAEEAADLAQDAAVRAYVHIRRWGVNGTGLDPLLNRIARNLLIDRYRRTTPHIVPLDDAGELHDPDQDPTEEVARRQRSRAVRTAIQDLPARHQTAITYSLNGLTPEEVGRRMGIGRNAADALLHRARRGLKERLQTVGEGMFGFAFGVRIRVQDVARKLGLDGSVGDAAAGALATSAVGVAAAAVVAVFAVTGGGGTPTGTPLNTGKAGFAGIVAAQNATTLGGAAEVAAPASSLSDGGSASSSSSIYKLGPTQTTWSQKGFDTDTSVPGPGGSSEPPIIRGTGYLHGKGTHEATPGDPGVLIARTVCNNAPVLCRNPADGS